MNADEARKVARKIVDDWEADIIAQPIDLTEAIAAALLTAAAQQREEDARIAQDEADRNLESAGRANMAGREVVCSHRQSDAETAYRIAAAIRGKP